MENVLQASLEMHTMRRRMLGTSKSLTNNKQSRDFAVVGLHTAVAIMMAHTIQQH